MIEDNEICTEQLRQARVLMRSKQASMPFVWKEEMRALFRRMMIADAYEEKFPEAFATILNFTDPALVELFYTQIGVSTIPREVVGALIGLELGLLAGALAGSAVVDAFGNPDNTDLNPEWMSYVESGLLAAGAAIGAVAGYRIATPEWGEVQVYGALAVAQFCAICHHKKWWSDVPQKMIKEAIDYIRCELGAHGSKTRAILEAVQARVDASVAIPDLGEYIAALLYRDDLSAQQCPIAYDNATKTVIVRFSA